MGAFWQYYSFPRASWDALFDGSTADASRRIVASAWWERASGDIPDAAEDRGGYLEAVYAQAPPALRELAERICLRGLDYTGLGPREARELDRLVCGFFCPEGLEEALAYRILGTQGLVAQELLDEIVGRSEASSRGGLFGFGARRSPATPVTLAPFLRTGRRIGTSVPPHVEHRYVLFDPVEAKALLAEVDRLLALDRPWSGEEFRLAARAEVRQALETATSEGHCLAGRYG